jgi:WhiB family redox-sensing transcriptional regulator
VSTAVELAVVPGPPPSPWKWRKDAACQGRTSLFFPAHAERSDTRQHREAKARAICLNCPVLHACRQWARETREYGFWGGESEEERAVAGFRVSLPTGRVARVIRATGAAPLAASTA